MGHASIRGQESAEPCKPARPGRLRGIFAQRYSATVRTQGREERGCVGGVAFDEHGGHPRESLALWLMACD